MDLKTITQPPMEPDHQPGDLVIINTTDNPINRQQAIIVEVYDNTILFRIGSNKQFYYSPTVITDNLGPATKQQLEQYGLKVEPEPEKPQ